MQIARQGLAGLMVAIISLGLVAGSMLISLTENPTSLLKRSPSTETATAAIVLPATYTNTPARSSSPAPTLTPTRSPTASLTPAPPTTCPAPAGWKPYQVQFGDTLDDLAGEFHTSAASIQAGNCLVSTELLPGTILYLPPLVSTPTASLTPTATLVPGHAGCQPPAGWAPYVIEHGDTLIGLGKLYHVTPAEIQAANCMGYSTILVHGVTIYLPPAAGLTPSSPGLSLTPTGASIGLP